MPTYDYRCESCSHEFEEMQSFKDDPLTVCPKCHESALRRLFGTGAAILFKGSGFYETDYRSESYKKAAKAEQEAAGGKSTDKAAGNGKAETNGTAPASAESKKTETKSSPTTS
jgi:putative FmdB family regulatory protein